MSDIQRLIEMQDAFNRHLIHVSELRDLYQPVPRSRRRKIAYWFKYRLPSRWRAVRRRVALWIAPELEEW